MKGFCKKVTGILKEAGWELTRNPRGSHSIFAHPDHPRNVPVPQNLHDKNGARRILKEAGLNPRTLG